MYLLCFISGTFILHVYGTVCFLVETFNIFACSAALLKGLFRLP